MNLVQLTGRLGRDVEFSQHGDLSVANIAIATDEYYSGNKKTEWHNVKAFGKTAEFLSNYFSKGSSIEIIGKLRTESFEKSDGTKQYRTYIYADKVSFGAGGSKDKKEDSWDV